MVKNPLKYDQLQIHFKKWSSPVRYVELYIHHQGHANDMKKQPMGMNYLSVSNVSISVKEGMCYRSI